ncbi:L-dopachrome tautomerase yellow-f-like [Phlebotomus papatasi]|uniref:L-dopachrome tautomerase yellow-f-like n=1 Tax=Phlebotomus papatasi TaxID=29031 RepID=UPI002483F408|nr:L-dopachrome tautomerase yellow-f-like [Phlebotomus papatasi]
MKLLILLSVCFWPLQSECGYPDDNSYVKNIYWWKDVNFENLPLKEDAYIGKYPYYIPTNNNILGVSYHAQSGLMFACIGRLREGIPSTLNAFCISDYSKGTSPYIWGFPNYEVNTLKASDYDYEKQPSSYYQKDLRIISTYHPTIDDSCNRAYVVDTGVVRAKDGKRYQVQNPAIVVFELPSNGCVSRNFPVIVRVEIPDSLWYDSLGFVYLTIDHQTKKGGCDNPMLYITNIVDRSIIVYDYSKNEFWKFDNHPSFDPVESETYLGDYQIRYGVLSMTLGWPDKKGNRIVYYAPGSTLASYATTTKTLRNQKKSSSTHADGEFRMVGYHGCDGQIHRQFLDLNCGVMFFAQMNSGAVKCWNVAKPFNPNYIGVVYKSDDQELFTDIQVDSEGYLWMHSCKVNVIFGSTEDLDLSEYNSRTHRVKVIDAIKGTVCENDYGIGDEITWQYMAH